MGLTFALPCPNQQRLVGVIWAIVIVVLLVGFYFFLMATLEPLENVIFYPHF